MAGYDALLYYTTGRLLGLTRVSTSSASEGSASQVLVQSDWRLLLLLVGIMVSVRVGTAVSVLVQSDWRLLEPTGRNQGS